MVFLFFIAVDYGVRHTVGLPLLRWSLVFRFSGGDELHSARLQIRLVELIFFHIVIERASNQAHPRENTRPGIEFFPFP